jgi:hypothetical protein
MRCAIIYLQAFDDMYNISTMSPTQRVYHEKSNESQLIALILRTAWIDRATAWIDRAQPRSIRCWTSPTPLGPFKTGERSRLF